jgi:putative phage-type endonuclease
MMDRDAWLKERRSGIGGSDAPAALGLSKWKTPYALWQEKRGEAADTPDNWAMRWGRTMEPELRQHYADITGREVFVADGIVRHPKHEWMFCTPDGGTGDGRLIEIKTARTTEGWGEPGTDQIPQAYLIQVQHSLCVTALPIADVLLGTYGQEPMMYHVEADHELHDMLIDSERAFWRCVLDGEPPEPANYADVIARWGRKPAAGEIDATREIRPAINALIQAHFDRKRLDQIEESAKAEIMRFMGEHGTLNDEAGKYTILTWKNIKPPMRFDSKAFQAAHPELYKQFTKAGELSRRFLLKG